MQVLPAGLRVAGAGLAAEYALAERPEAAEPLDIDVEQLARPLALIADDRATRWSREPRDAIAAKHLPDRRGRQAELSSDDQGTRIRVLACREDPLLHPARQPARLVLGHRRTISQRRPAALLVAAPQPVAGRAARAAGRRGRLRTLTGKNKRDNTATRLEREAHPSRRLRSVEHSGPPQRAGVSTTTSLAGGPDAISRLAGVSATELAGRLLCSGPSRAYY